MQVDRQPLPAVKTTCPYCGVGCGVLATAFGTGDIAVSGDPDHPANFGRLCSKGSALGETLALDGRLLTPVVDGAPASWNTALDRVATEFRAAIDAHGPESVAFYVSGQLLTEDYYVANKLMKGFIGAANIDTNSRLCMSSSVAGHKRAFGADIVPGCYDDLDHADLVVIVGSNLAWCHPVLYQRLLTTREQRGTKIVVIDPRATATTDEADLHLAIAPGSDVALFNGLLSAVLSRGALDQTFIDEHTNGFADAVHVAEGWTQERVASVCALDEHLIDAFYTLFSANARAVTIYSQGVNQSVAGTDKVNAIINCHLATGRIGKVGAGPLSVTGQPNAMGGREVGGMATMLACHMDIERDDHRRIVQSFWSSPAIAQRPGLKAVDLFDAVERGSIKALWIMGTSPVNSMPDADAVRAALGKCPFVVVSDVQRTTDTTVLADVLLPSLAWGEKDGTVTNSERRISRQRPFMPTPGEARADWWQMAEVGKRLGWRDAFAYAGPAEIFAEYAALSAHQNNGARDFDIGACASFDRPAYEAMTPFQWPRLADAHVDARRFFAGGRFYTDDRRARFVATPVKPLAVATDANFPFILNTGRIRDQWHTMTRTGRAPALNTHIAEPFAEIHPDDAASHGIAEADLVSVTSPRGRVLVRALLTARQRRGSIFVPMHWTDQLASTARIDALVSRATDPVSGQPEFKATPVAIARFAARWFGFAVTRHQPKFAAELAYWASARTRSGWRTELAGSEPVSDWEREAREILGVDPERVECLSYRDDRAGIFRLAAFDGDVLLGAVFIAPKPVTVARNFTSDALAVAFPSALSRFTALAGKAGAEQRDSGPTICACFGVGFNDIVEAVTAGGCMSVDAVGAALRAGTNCGSCRPELKRIIHDHAAEKAI